MIKSNINVLRSVSLRKPIMLCGVPGIGSIATITVAYFLHKLNAQLLAEIKSPYFHNIAFSSNKGSFKSPLHQLFFWKSSTQRDLLLLFGNTQPYTSYGQYELCSTILDFVGTLHCSFIISLGGVKPDPPLTSPQLLGIFTDLELKHRLCASGIQVMEGRVYGMAGLFVGLAALKKMMGFCLLTRTSNQCDVEAVTRMANFVNSYLEFHMDTDDLPKLLSTRGALKRMEECVGIPSSLFSE